jgi:hypothetical protein
MLTDRALYDQQVRPGPEARHHDVAGPDATTATDQEGIAGTQGGCHGRTADEYGEPRQLPPHGISPPSR